MELKPNSLSMKNLLNRYDVLQVPNFQRDYSWDKPYYSAFLEDIIKTLVSTTDSDQVTPKDYFIGTMVLAGKENENVMDVVDGQQRLTVVTILLSALTRKFFSLEEDDLGDGTFRYIKRKNDYGQWQAKLISKTSYPYLETYIQSKDKSSAPETTTAEEELIKKTYEYYNSELEEEKLKRIYPALEEFSYAEILTFIRDQILATRVIVIDTPDKKLAYEIFEILNAKGKSLASIDLIKNKIISVFHGDENGKDKLIEEKWENIKSILRSRENDVGLATFYRHYWISKYKKTTNVKLYDDFINFIEQDETDQDNLKNKYESFIDELLDEAKRYMIIVNPLETDFNRRIEKKWLQESLISIEKYFGVSQTRIAFLALFDVKEKGYISPRKFKEAIKYIENFVFAYSVVVKNQANIYESRFSNFAIKLRKTESKSETNIIIDEMLYEKFNESFPSYSDFSEKFKVLKFSKRKLGSNIITKYIMKNISLHIEGEDTPRNNSSIEHIIAEDENNSGTLLIGNLISLEQNINNSAEDLSFDEKLSLYEDSKYSQVQKFCQEYKNKDFTEDTIQKRSEELSQYYYTKILDKPITMGVQVQRI